MGNSNPMQGDSEASVVAISSEPSAKTRSVAIDSDPATSGSGLDGRQIFFLFVGSAVFACLVFAIGVFVGRRIERGAAAQAALLLAVGAFVLIEGVKRLFEPPEVASGLMIVFGIVGLIGNLIGLLILASGRSANLNMRAAFLEVVNDALGSVAVLAAAAVITTTGWYRADAIASILIGVLIIPRTIRLLRETIDVLLESTPKGLDLELVRQHLHALPHVHDVHDLHASQVATGIPILTAHLVVDDTCFHDGHLGELLDQVQACIHTDFGIEHSTIQFESVDHAAHEHATHE